MGRYNMEEDPTWGVNALVESGVPVGPLDSPQWFYCTSSGSKLHATTSCSRVKRRYTHGSTVNFLTTAKDRYCTTCVDGPTSSDAKSHVKQARLAISSRAALVRLRAHLLVGGDLAEVDDPAVAAAAGDLDAAVPIGSPTWELVSRAEAVVRTCAAITDAPVVHDDMVSWVAPLARAAKELLAQLKEAASAGTDDGALVRTCVLDLMAQYSSSSYDSGSRTPETSNAPLPECKQFPALCTTGSDYGHRMDSSGFKRVLDEAWRTWRAEVAATGDVNGGRDAVVRSTRIPELEPEHVEQLVRGTPVTPPRESLWDWMIAEWRHQAMVELNVVLSLWEQRYTTDLARARELPAKIVGLVEWELKDRSADNASTRVLAQLPVIFHPQVATGLTLAPGVVANWLERFDVVGKAGTEQRNGQWSQPGSHTSTVQVLADAVETDNVETLTLALRMWEPPAKPANDRFSYRSRGPMASLRNAVQIAQGVNA